MDGDGNKLLGMCSFWGGIQWDLSVKYFYSCVDVFQGLQGLPGDKGIRVSYQASLGLCTVVDWLLPEPLRDS